MVTAKVDDVATTVGVVSTGAFLVEPRLEQLPLKYRMFPRGLTTDSGSFSPHFDEEEVSANNTSIQDPGASQE